MLGESADSAAHLPEARAYSLRVMKLVGERGRERERERDRDRDRDSDRESKPLILWAILQECILLGEYRASVKRHSA